MAAFIDDLLELPLGPVGWGIAAVGAVLALSPAARHGLRRALVRSMAIGITATQGLRQAPTVLRDTWDDLRAEVQAETNARLQNGATIESEAEQPEGERLPVESGPKGDEAHAPRRGRRSGRRACPSRSTD